MKYPQVDIMNIYFFSPALHTGLRIVELSEFPCARAVHWKINVFDIFLTPCLSVISLSKERKSHIKKISKKNLPMQRTKILKIIETIDKKSFHKFYICGMKTKGKKTTRVHKKTAQFTLKTSPELIKILTELADKKGMTKVGLIEYLLRREFDFLVNPIFSAQKNHHATQAELEGIERGLAQMEAKNVYTEEEAEAEIEKILWEE